VPLDTAAGRWFVSEVQFVALALDGFFGM